MASPQTEDGYTRIANELLEALSRLDASGSAWRVFMVIVRKTYGYQKKSDCVSLSQFVALSGLTHRSVCRGVDELVRRNVILVENSGYTNKYSVQKNYELWGSVKPVTSDKNDTGSSVKPVTETSDKNDTYKRKKERKKISEDESSVSNQKNMGWKNKLSDNDDDLQVIDLDSRKVLETEESKQEKETKELNAKIRANLKTIEPLRGIPWGTGKDMNFHVKIYRDLLNSGHSHASIVSAFMDIVDTPHWKEKKGQGEYPGMNTVQFHLRNKKPL